MPGRRLPVVLGFLIVAAGCSASGPGGDSRVQPVGGPTDSGPGPGAGAGGRPAGAPADGGVPGDASPAPDPSPPAGDASADQREDIARIPAPDSGAGTSEADGALDAPGGLTDGQGPGFVDAASSGADGRTANGSQDGAGADPESGRLVGITAAHNAVRAAVQSQTPLPPLAWNAAIADYAQQWATSLATTMCAQPQHRSAVDLLAKGYGENLATFGVGGTGTKGGAGTASNAQQAVGAWAAEQMCWTFGTILGTEKCDKTCYTNLHSDGCGHYTQVVWRTSTELGCGVATCKNGALTEDIWICNYAPAGNFIGRAPY